MTYPGAVINPLASGSGITVPAGSSDAFPAYLAPPPSGGDDTATLNALIAALPTDPYGLGLPVGAIFLHAGTYQVGASADLSNLGSFVKLIGPGKQACTIAYYGSGHALYAHNPHLPNNNQPGNDIKGFATVLDGFTIDGTHSGAGAVGLDYGDNEGGQIGPDLMIRNFSGTGSIGLNLASRVWWTEKTKAHVITMNNATAVQISSPAGVGGDSWGYNDFAFDIFAWNDQQGVIVTDGALIYHGRMIIRGNIAGGTGIAALTLSGGCSIQANKLDMQLETGVGGSSAPQTINFDGGSILGCWGTMNFSETWVPTNGLQQSTNVFQYTGAIVGLGDADLNPTTGTNTQWDSPPVGTVLYRKATITPAGGIATIPLFWGDYFDLGVLAHNLTISLNSQYLSPNEKTIRATQASSGGPYTITWPAGVVLWAGGTPPVMSTGAGAVDLYTIKSFGDSSQKYYGYALQALA